MTSPEALYVIVTLFFAMFDGQEGSFIGLFGPDDAGVLTLSPRGFGGSA